jgi:hypothetical protein
MVRLRSLMAPAGLALLLPLQQGCVPKCAKGFEPDYLGAEMSRETVEEKPRIPVPLLEAYGWIEKANLVLAGPEEIDAVKKKVEDFYSGYPAFLMAVRLLTKSRGAGFEGSPARIADAFRAYYGLKGISEATPLVSTSAYEMESVKGALLEAWKKANPGSGAGGYSEIIKDVNYNE